MQSALYSVIIGAGLLIIGAIVAKCARSETEISFSMGIVVSGTILVFTTAPYWINVATHALVHTHTLFN